MMNYSRSQQKIKSHDVYLLSMQPIRAGSSIFNILTYSPVLTEKLLAKFQIGC